MYFGGSWSGQQTGLKGDSNNGMAVKVIQSKISTHKNQFVLNYVQQISQIEKLDFITKKLSSLQISV